MRQDRKRFCRLFFRRFPEIPGDSAASHGDMEHHSGEIQHQDGKECTNQLKCGEIESAEGTVMMFCQNSAHAIAVKESAFQSPGPDENRMVHHQIRPEMEPFFRFDQVNQEIGFLPRTENGAGTDAESFIETNAADGFPLDENGDGNPAPPDIAERYPAERAIHETAGKTTMLVGYQSGNTINILPVQIAGNSPENGFRVGAVIIGERDNITLGIAQTDISGVRQTGLGSIAPDREPVFKISYDWKQPVVFILIHENHLKRRGFLLVRQGFKKIPQHLIPIDCA